MKTIWFKNSTTGFKHVVAVDANDSATEQKVLAEQKAEGFEVFDPEKEKKAEETKASE